MALYARAPRLWLRPFAFALALGSGVVFAPEALASQVKFSTKAFDTDDEGNLSAAGKGAAISELPSLPGEEVWPLHIWAQLDKGAPGPLYVEFFDKLPGSSKRYMAWRYEHGSYEGGKYVSIDVELDGNTGFNKGHTYTVELNQLNDKGKNLKLASSKLTLVYTEEAERSDEDDDGGDEGPSEQDILDSFAGGDEEANGSDEAPPPVTPPSTKKGCRIDPSLGAGMGAAPGILAMLLLGAGLIRRRE